MADEERLSDLELVQELEKYGETVKLPIKRDKRPLLLKKLNHFRARARVHNGTPQTTTRSRQSATAKSKPASPPSRAINSTRSSSRTLNASITSDRYRPYGAGPSNLDVLSSDDNDIEPIVEPAYQAGISRSSRPSANISTNVNHVSARDKKSQFSDSVLRTMRRRTAELPPRRTRRSEVLELSAEKHDRPSNYDEYDESIDRSSEDEIPVPSPARSRLYPDLSKFTSFLSRSKDNNEDKFESSDSDIDVSTYEVENKSVNTSFPTSFHNNRSPGTSGYAPSSSPASTSYTSQSASLRQRTVPRRKQYWNGPQRVQQYSARSLEILPQILVGIAIFFFIALSVTYIVIHKDFFFSWFSSSSNIGSGDHILLCEEGMLTNCYGREEIDKALQYTETLFEELSIKKGQVLCDKARLGEDVMRASVLKDRIYRSTAASTHAERLYECCLDHILANPHWNIRALTEDGSAATALQEVAKLESNIASMSSWCRLRRSFTHVLYGICTMIIVIFCILLASMYIKYRLKQREIEQREVYAMVEKIIDILQDHHEQTKGDDSDEPQYLAVQHVRDQLLPPSKRRRLQPIWDKAVEFIAANESRIRLETRLIHGDEFEVWHWLQLCSTTGHKLKTRSTTIHEQWLRDHQVKGLCTQNYAGSSGGMEVEAALTVWKRSTQHLVRYTTLVGDGDTKTFLSLTKEKPYREIPIRKEECVNHVAKRLNSGLRSLKTSLSKQSIRIGGNTKGSLTDPTVHNGKIWQGQAFGENNDNTSNQVIYSPTACLKIRNMFDSNVESEDNWEDNVTDAILEKCKNIEHIVHIYVDVDSSEGCVYLKCSSCEAAGKARQALHGWWFDGRLVTVKYMKTENYHKRWPEARNASKHLKPSTDQMRSLSQPFYRSSLEMT